MPEPDVHPHELAAGIPDRLPAERVRALSRIEPARAISAIAAEWALIAGCIALNVRFPTPILYAASVVFLGARQHALSVIGHDAVHYRLLPGRRANEWVADLFLWWPIFASNQGFRRFHGDHHRFLGAPNDTNRKLWRTHAEDGSLRREWVYPKSRAALAAKLLWRGCGLTGIGLTLMGLFAVWRFAKPGYALIRTSFYVAVAAAITLAGAWRPFLLYWMIPFWTWNIASHYIRVVCEHSAVPSRLPFYEHTRTTLPSLLDRWLVVPRNISYHAEHHAYPSVPFYNLPALHAELAAQPGFRDNAVVCRGVLASLRQCVRPAVPGPLPSPEAS
jgi:fatty acid desaturase